MSKGTKTIIICFVLLYGAMGAIAQKPQQRDAAEILLGLQKLNFLGSVLYVAAHPDDENTRIISYFSNKVLANTAYLSMTRGDGGQNLIGSEIREYLGIIRTQELLAARRTDGGRQFFTRANDFGYSKSADETQEIWDREQVLSDVVWTFRNFRPDVVITRFPTDGRGGHGHHTTSALLAAEAFNLAGDKKAFSDQLSLTQPWSPKRLYLNTGRWWNQSVNADTDGVITLDVGEYSPLLGQSYSEIAAISRSQHKSQGFGSTGTRGEQLEFLEYRRGDRANKDIFEGINTTWTRVEGGKKIQGMIEEAIGSFIPSNPGLSVSKLLEIRKAIQTIKDPYWKSQKTRETDRLIADCLGLYLEVSSSDYSAAPGEQINLSFEAVNRSGIAVVLNKIGNKMGLMDSVMNTSLPQKNKITFNNSILLPSDMTIGQPYWLQKEGTLGMYSVEDRRHIGKPENDPAITVDFTVEIAGEKIVFTRPVIYKWNDPVGGELYRPFIITPPVFVNILSGVMIFDGVNSREVEVVVKAGRDDIKGIAGLELPAGWHSKPESIPVEIHKKGGEQRLVFNVTAPQQQMEGKLKAFFNSGGQHYAQGLVEISYDHFPIQSVFPESAVKIVKLNIEKKGDRIGYIHGAGDDIPKNLRNIGYEVWEMNDDEITAENLTGLDAVVLGIRALNTRERLPYVMNDLLKYVENGGTLIVQYNTNHRLLTAEFSPYPLQLSRDRVSRENAEITILAPEHRLMNFPNKISGMDFEGWVQERGLYFPDEWDSRFIPVLQSNDPGESQKKGGLLVGRYGKGYYIYSGYSWFRQLPAGVPGAYRLFANMLSVGAEN